MNDIVFEIKNFIYETGVLCINYLRKLHPSTVLLTFALIFALFLRKMTFRRILSFLFVVLLLFILLVRTEAFVIQLIGEESSQIGIAVMRTVFLIACGLILLYHVIKE